MNENDGIKGLGINAFHAAGECRRQVKNVTKFVKMSTLWNFMNIFVTTRRNAFR